MSTENNPEEQVAKAVQYYLDVHASIKAEAARVYTRNGFCAPD
jgi:hypothetical protein